MHLAALPQSIDEVIKLLTNGPNSTVVRAFGGQLFAFRNADYPSTPSGLQRLATNCCISRLELTL